MSDAVVIAITTAVCTALPLVLAQVVNIMKTSKNFREINEHAEARTVQLAEVKEAVNETKKATVKLEEGHEYIKSQMATNTAMTAEGIAKMIDDHIGKSAPAPLGKD